MGRSALVRSTDEQKAHAHARRKKYNESERAKYLKRQYNRQYYKRQNGRKAPHKPQPTLPHPSDVLPDRLLALARSSSPSFRESPGPSHGGLSEADATDAGGGRLDRFGTYTTALRRYFSLEEQLNHDPAGQARREKENLLRQVARDVVDAYENMARG